MENSLNRSVAQIFQDAEQMLYTAKIGLDLMILDDPRKVGAGVRIAVVFGRHVTNALQKLRSIIPEFNDWYVPYVKEMEEDELMKYIYRTRNTILKETDMPIDLTIVVKDKEENAQQIPRFTELSEDDLGNPVFHIEPVTGPNITIVMKNPSIKINLELSFLDPPSFHLGKKIESTDPENICKLYLLYLEKLVNEAKNKFAKGMFLNKDEFKGLIERKQ